MGQPQIQLILVTDVDADGEIPFNVLQQTIFASGVMAIRDVVALHSEAGS